MKLKSIAGGIMGTAEDVLQVVIGVIAGIIVGIIIMVFFPVLKIAFMGGPIGSFLAILLAKRIMREKSNVILGFLTAAIASAINMFLYDHNMPGINLILILLLPSILIMFTMSWEKPSFKKGN
jgi:hypothetical protein